jgi:hypothetical protein
MLNLFLEWARQIQANHGLESVEAHVVEGAACDNPSARLDIDTPTLVARITCWESGDYDAEVLDIETEQTIYSSHGVLHAGQAIGQQIFPFLTALGLSAE